VRAGRRAVAFDLGDDRRRLRLILSDEEIAQIEFVRGDITDFNQVNALFENHGVTHVVHLAGLQVPFCRANPVTRRAGQRGRYRQYL